jgi:hypothetical protein
VREMTENTILKSRSNPQKKPFQWKERSHLFRACNCLGSVPLHESHHVLFWVVYHEQIFASLALNILRESN